MNVKLVANLSANGEQILAEQANAYQAPPEISGMAFAKVMECGNMIMGKTSYDMFSGIAAGILANLDVVVLNPEKVDAEVYTAKTPEDAIRHLEEKGFDQACIAGGTMTFNSFLEAGLADEIFFNHFPVIIHGGGILQTAEGKILDYKLESAENCSGVTSLHYIKE